MDNFDEYTGHDVPVLPSPPVEPASYRQSPNMPHVIPPTAVEHQWWDQLNEHVDIDRVIAVAMAYHRSRCPWEEPGFAENRRELLRLREMLNTELADHPNDPLLAYELSRLRGALRRYW